LDDGARPLDQRTHQLAESAHEIQRLHQGQPGRDSRQPGDLCQGIAGGPVDGLDKALAQSVQRYSSKVAATRDMFLAVLCHDLRGPLSCDLGPVCEAALEDICAGNPELQFEQRMSGDLTLQADAARMQQALSNLLSNAVQPLVQAPNASAETHERSKTSPGLGLFIVREIVPAHGGAIWVESSAASGTVFTIRLPRAPSDRLA
jgi:signal transduction histidine kinase